MLRGRCGGGRGAKPGNRILRDGDEGAATTIGRGVPPRGARIALTASLCAVFIISQFYRSAIAVIAPDLATELGLSAETLGLLTGAFFVAAAAMQIPVGILLDRFGARRVIPVLLISAVAGALILGAGHRAAALILGQFLIGLGCSGVFMGGLLTFSRWFPTDRFALVAASAIAVSNLGALFSGTPLALAAAHFGWRVAIQASAGITAVLAVMVLILVRDAPPGHAYFQRRAESLGETLRGLGAVLRDRDIRRILPLAFMAYSSMMAVRALWGGPYLADIHGLGSVARGNVLLAMSAATLLGVLCYGPLDRLFDRRKPIILAGGVVTVATLAALALIPGPSLWLTVLLFCLLAGAGAYYAVLLAHGRALFDDRLSGRAMTTINFATFSGAATVQIGSGALIGLVPAGDAASGHPEIAYRLMFAVLAVALLIALTIYARVRDTRPSEI